MSGFEVWARKEMLEIARTWRRFVLPGMLLIMAILSPVLARITPELLRSVGSGDPGVIIQVPDPTSPDALRQWGQALGQLVLVAVIIVSAGLISNDLKDGAAQLALVKPLSRRDYVLAKVAVLIGFLVASTAIASVICGITTQLIFQTVPVRDLAELSAVWLVFAAVIVCVMALVSTIVPSQVAASGIGIALYFSLSLIGLWTPANHYSPIGLLSSLDSIATGKSVPLLVPLVTAILLGVLSIILTILHFQRKTIR